MHAGRIRAGRSIDAPNHGIQKTKGGVSSMPEVKTQTMKELETAVLFWAGGDPEKTLATVTGFGVRTGQLGIRGDLDLGCVLEWKRALEAANFAALSVTA